MAGLGLLVLMGAFAFWAMRDSSQSFAGSYGMRVDRQVGRPMWTSLVAPGRAGAEKVTITDLEPRFGVDEAKVRVQYLICELDQKQLAAEGVGAFGFGGGEVAVERYCSATRPAVGSEFHLRSNPSEELIVGLTPTRPGRSVVRSFAIEFDDGWRHGRDAIDVRLRIDAHSRSR